MPHHHLQAQPSGVFSPFLAYPLGGCGNSFGSSFLFQMRESIFPDAWCQPVLEPKYQSSSNDGRQVPQRISIILNVRPVQIWQRELLSFCKEKSLLTLRFHRNPPHLRFAITYTAVPQPESRGPFLIGKGACQAVSSGVLALCSAPHGHAGPAERSAFVSVAAGGGGSP